MKRWFSQLSMLGCVAYCLLATDGTIMAQPSSSLEPAKAPQPSVPPTQPVRGWVVRDPRTGRWYQQEVRTVEQPVARWEWKQVEQTVYVPQTVTETQPRQETVYVPQTSYVMQYKPKGIWNPLRPAVAAYEYVPHTTWVAQSRVTNRPTEIHKWVPKQEKVVVPQLVQSTGKSQQLVQTEISPPPTYPRPLQTVPQVAAVPQYRQPIIRIPILARRQVTTATNQTASFNPVFPPSILPGSGERNYAAPLTTSIPLQQTAFRDPWQTGLPATVVR